VVHRDVKPANVIYDHDSGALKITDFGIASLIDDNKTRTGTLLGTPSYMSPEQATGEKVDGRTDIYSLGVSLYQLLTGQLPFVADSLGNLMYQITNTRQQDIITIRRELTACLSWVVNKAMEKDPNERFQTGDEMADALRRCELELNKKQKRKRAKA
jgi:serine/threonine-protein kinase